MGSFPLPSPGPVFTRPTRRNRREGVLPLLTIWSPKGGSGTSVVAATCALVLARSRNTRLVDLAGDQPAILGLGTEPISGVADWLAIGPTAPTEALDRLAIDVAPNLTLLARGSVPSLLAPDALAEAGAALGVALRDGEVSTVVDAGLADTPASRALLEVSDVSIIVIRECYLALRRAVRMPLVGRAAGIFLVTDGTRSLGAREVSDVLGRSVVASVPVRDGIARAVDAGSLPSRIPEPLVRAASDALNAVGLGEKRRGEAA